VPAAQRLVRGAIYSGRETNVLGFVKEPRGMKLPELLARRHMRNQVKDEELLEKVTPDYTIGCKRILPSNKWYPALSQPNVELVSDGVKEVRAHSIVSNDGSERGIDTLILGTGFKVTDLPMTHWVKGRDGRVLREAWSESMRAHLGTATAGFPNFFMLLGPNTGLGHNSMIYMIESQVAYIVDALREMEERGATTVEVRPEAESSYNERIDAQMEGTVWNTGCTSWYLDDTGRNPTLWPDWTWRFRQRTSRFDPSAYELA
jgi:cation diffusion facilitator CzcD-associated flavoprotein CzcO